MDFVWLDKNLHTHTRYSDGENTMAEMAERACELGLKALAFTDHSHTSFDESYCMPRARYGAYKAEARALKSALEGRIDILCGIEQDFYSDAPTQAFDWVGGAVHYLRVPGAHAGTVVGPDNPQGEFLPVDETAEIFASGCEAFFGGDFYAFAEAYYDTEAQVAKKTNCDLIGHFDLFKRFNGSGRFFDEDHPRYRRAWQKAADALLASGRPFEVNFRAFAAGKTPEPYPSRAICEYLSERGAVFVPSADAHAVGELCSWDFLRKEPLVS